MEKRNELTTDFSESMDRSSPHGDYPRPMLKRDSFLSLNGLWDFAYSESEPKEYKEKILVPFPPESRLSGIGRTHADEELLFYRRNFTFPDGFKKEKILLHFGAVDQTCKVFINECKVGENEGGYLPFFFDITDFLRDGENEIKVVAKDTLSPIYPYGKQKKKRGGMWYTPVSGIWQTVWLESLPAAPIKNIKITPAASSVKIELDTEAKQKKLTLKDSGEVFVFEENEITLTPSEIKLWTPENPYVYRFTLETETDRIESYFALREISVERVHGVPRLCLNGEPYLFHGLLDQGYFPDGIYLPATIEGYKKDITTAKALGFNMLRKHIKIEPAVFYYLCDTLGMVVFQDMVNNSDYSFIRDTALPTVGLKRLSDKRLHKNEKSREIFINHSKETLRHLYNHPSILCYTIFNEGWGQFTADKVYRELKALDGTRVFDATSGWFWQRESDLDSHHVYFKKLKTKIHPELPTFISEFGGYSHRCDGHLFGDGNYGYKTYEKRSEFEAALESLYLNEVLPLVKKGVSALIYTQISDVEDETNGFLTYDRKVLKVDAEHFFKISKALKDAAK